MALSKAEEADLKTKAARQRFGSKMAEYSRTAGQAAAVGEGIGYAVLLRKMAKKYPQVEKYKAEATILIGALEAAGFMLTDDGAVRHFLGGSIAGKATLAAWFVSEGDGAPTPTPDGSRRPVDKAEGEIGITPGMLFRLVKALKNNKLSTEGIQADLGVDAETAGRIFRQVRDAVDNG